MRRKVVSDRIRVALIILPMYFGACEYSWAQRWQALYTFGDSYTDSGAGYVDGNGPTAVVYLAASLGVPFTFEGDPKSSGKSLNFAVSGAGTGKGEGFRVRQASSSCGGEEALLGRGMRNQVVDFTELVNSGAIRFNPDKTLFFLAGGLNDSTILTSTTISNLKEEIEEIYAVGGRYFLIALLPTRIPSNSSIGVRLNPAIAKLPGQLQALLPSIHVSLSRWGKYFDGIMETPGRYGITNTSDKCAGRAVFGEDPKPCSSPNTHFYFHDGHPSTAVQRIVGQELAHEVMNAFKAE